MKRLTSVLGVIAFGVLWLSVCAVVAPLARVFRANSRREPDVQGAIGYDDNDPGLDVDGDRA